MLYHCEFIIGNSSSGIGETPFFRIPTINIGDRQKGRVILPGVITCSATRNDIIKSINKICSKNFKKKIKKKLKKYDNFDVAKKISSKMILFNFKKYNKKDFYDIKK